MVVAAVGTVEWLLSGGSKRGGTMGGRMECDSEGRWRERGDGLKVTAE